MPAFSQPPMRRFGDHDATRDAVFDTALGAVKSLPPVENSRYRLELTDPQYVGPQTFSQADHTNALLEGRTLGRRIAGTFRLTDKASNAVVDTRRLTVAHVPYLTRQGTFVYEGSPLAVSSQLRLMPGVYTRRKGDGTIESHSNFLPGQGVPHRLGLDPAAGVFKVHVGQAEIPAAALLKAFGTTDDELKVAWGPELATKNLKATKPYHLDKLYEKFGPAGPVADDKAAAIAARLSKYPLDPWVMSRTLGVPHKTYGKDVILAATKKLLGVARGTEEPDDRDNPAFSTVWGPEHLIAERLRRATPFLNKALWAITNVGNLKRLQPGLLSPAVRHVFTHSGLALNPEGASAAEYVDHGAKITKVGEGGIGRSSDAAPMSARNVNPGQIPFIDHTRASESESVGLDLRVAFGTRLGADNRIYAPLRDRRTNKLVYRSPQDVANATIAFPEINASTDALVPAVRKGKLTYVPRHKVDYVIPSMEQTFSPLTNLVPLKSAGKPHRSSMGARMVTQSIPLTNAEAPLVRTQVPGQPGKSFEELFGPHMGAVHSRPDSDGTVTAVTPQGITVKYDDGRTDTHELYHHHPAGRTTGIHNTPVVRPGQRIEAGTLLAPSNFTDHNGHAAYGKTARVGFMIAPGVYEDAIRVSRSFADKLKSDHLDRHSVETAPDTIVGRTAHAAAFPGIHTLETLKTIDADGVVKPGTVVGPGHPLILAVRKKDGGYGRLSRAGKVGWSDASEVWEHNEPGTVVGVTKTPKGPVVLVNSQRVAQDGDKLSGRHGNKGVIVISPDHEMPISPDGKPLDVILSSLGTISRTNPSAIFEAALGKIAAKTGKPYVVEDFKDNHSVGKFVEDELAKHGVDFMEHLTDPQTGRTIPNVGVGNLYLMKLSHVAAKKAKGRGLGGYDETGQPLRGQAGKAMRMSLGDTNALLSHGATNFVRDAHLNRGQTDDEFWTSYMAGFPAPRHTTSKAFDRFLTELRAAGVNPVRRDSRYHLTALLDKDVREMAGDREVKNGETLNFAKNGEPVPGGLFDLKTFGAVDSPQTWAKINLHEPLPHPLMEEPIRRLLDLTAAGYRDVIAGRKTLPDGATGPAGIAGALAKINVQTELAKTRERAQSSRKTAREDANRKLVYLKGFEKTGINPADLMTTMVPVLPPAYRPVSKSSGRNDVVVHDSNLLYKDLIEANHALRDLSKEVHDTGDERLNLYDAVKAAYGIGDPVGTKNRERGVKGVLARLLGTTSKYCYDAATEILTHRGWIPFSELTVEDTVATCDPVTCGFVWQQPSAVHIFDHDGPMVRLTNGRPTTGEKPNKTVDLLVTVGHRHWYRTYKPQRKGGDPRPLTAGWAVALVEQLPKGAKHFQTAAATWTGHRNLPDGLHCDVDPEIAAEFVGFWVAEGWIHSSGSSVQIGQSETANPEKCVRIAELISKLGFEFSTGLQEYRETGRARWWYLRNSRVFADWLTVNVGLTAHEKRLSRFVLDWDVPLLAAFLKGYLAGDGSKRCVTAKASGTGKTINKNRNVLTDVFHGFGTVSLKLYDALQEVCCKLGLTVRPHKPYLKRTATVYYGSIVGRWFTTVSTTPTARQQYTEHYSGKVYCCTTANGLLFVRRNGTVCVSGNSFMQQKLLGTPVDLSGRGQVLPNPDYDMDQIGLPESIAWDIYHPFVVRRLVRAGYPRVEAARLAADRLPEAKKQLLAEMEERPVTATRYPSLHRYNILGFRPQLVAGDAIQMNHLMTKSQSMDFDGDHQINSVFIAMDTETREVLNSQKDHNFWEDRTVTARFKTTTPIADGLTYHCVNLEEFPHGERVGEHEHRTFFAVPPGVKVVAYDEVKKTPVLADVSHWSVHRDREIEIVKLGSGRQIVTDDDPRAVYGLDPLSFAFVRRRPREAVGLMVPRVDRYADLGGHTASIRLGDVDNREVRLDHTFGYLCGAVVGNGWVTDTGSGPRTICCALTDPGVITAYESAVREVINPASLTYVTVRTAADAGGFAANGRWQCTDREFGPAFVRWVGSGARNKHLPPFYLAGDRSFRLGLLAGLMDTDGSVSQSGGKTKPQLMASYTSASLRLVQEVQHLCRSLGVLTSITVTKTPAGEPFWMLVISAPDLQAVGLKLCHTAKLRHLATAESSTTCGGYVRNHMVPLSTDLANLVLPHVRKVLGTGTTTQAVSKAKVLHRISRRHANAVVAALDGKVDHPQWASFVAFVRDESTVWDVVESYEATGVRETGYDLTVPGFETFMSTDGVILSNTSTINVPLSDEAVKEVYEKLLPSKNLFSPTNMKASNFLPNMEYVQGLHASSVADDKNPPIEFRTKAEAIAAYKRGEIGLGTRVKIAEA